LIITQLSFDAAIFISFSSYPRNKLASTKQTLLWLQQTIKHTPLPSK